MLAKQICALMKAEWLDSWNKAFAPKTRGTKKPLINPAIRGVILTLVLTAIFIKTFIDFFSNLIAFMGPGILPSAAFVAAFAFILMTNFMSVGAQLFEAGRYEQLKAMPIAQTTIAWVRLIEGLEASFITSFFVMICAVGAWIPYSDVASCARLGIYGTVLATLYTSLISIFCFCCGYALKRKFRGGPMFVIVLVSCVVLLPVVVMGYCLAMPDVQDFVVPYLAYVGWAQYALELFSQACAGDVIVLALIAVPVIIVYYLVARWLAQNLDSFIALKEMHTATRSFVFDTTEAAAELRAKGSDKPNADTALQPSARSRTYAWENFSQTHRSMLAIAKKDGLLCLRNSSVAMNAAIPLLLALALPLILCFVWPFMKLQNTGHMLCAAAACIPIYTLTLPMSLYAITLEGNKWWHMQTVPLLARDIMRAKLFACLLPTGVIFVIDEILYNLFLPLSVVERLVVLLIPFSALILMETVALMLDASDPNFSWDTTHETARAFKRQKWAMLMIIIFYVVLGLSLLASINPLGDIFGGDATYLTGAVFASLIMLGLGYLAYDRLISSPLAEG